VKEKSYKLAASTFDSVGFSTTTKKEKRKSGLEVRKSCLLQMDSLTEQDSPQTL